MSVIGTATLKVTPDISSLTGRSFGSRMARVGKVAGAALAGAFVIETKAAITTTQDLTKSTISLHKNLGLTNKVASEWAGVAKARGADTTKLGMAFKTLASQISSAGHGSEASVAMFKELGFSQKDINKSMTDTEFAIGKVADGLHKLPPGADKAAFAGKLFGRGWQTIAPILRDGSAAMQDQLDTVEKYGGVLQGKTLKQQEELLANIRENKIAWQGFQVTLASAVTPALNVVSDQFQRIAAINASKDLTGEEKFKRIATILQDDFAKALDVFTKIIPEVASRVGEQAPKIALALVQGFLGANVWGKLLLGSWFIGKLGATNKVGALGGKLGLALGRAFVTSAAGSMILEKLGMAAILGPGGELKLIAGGSEAGTLWGKAFSRGAVIGLALGLALIVNEVRERFGKQIGQAFTKAGKAVDKFGDRFGPLAHVVTTPVHQMLDQFRNLWQGISHIGKLVDDLIHGRWKAAWGDFKMIGKDAVQGVLNAGKMMLGPFRDAFNWIKNRWPHLDLKAPFRGLAGFVTGAFRPIRNAIQWVVDKVKWLLDHIPDIPHVDLTGPLHGQGVIGGGGSIEDVIAASRRARHGGQYGGLVTAEGIIPLRGFQGGGIVGKKGLPPGSKDTVPAMLEVGELVIPKKLVDATKSNAKKISLSLSGEVGKGYKKVIDDSKKLVKDHHKQIDTLRTNALKTTKKFRQDTVDDFKNTSKQGTDLTNRMKSNVTDSLTRMKKGGTDQSGAMRKGVVGDFQSMDKAVSKAIKKLADMTNKALKALGVKPVQFGVAESGGGGGGGNHQTGGMVVPGTGSGDTVPLHAMVEPGERVFVLNRNASAHLSQLESLNKQVPRFQKGGAYRYPFDKSMPLGRIDEGVDAAVPGAPIGAIGDARVTSNFNAFSPAYGNASQGMVYKFDHPPKGYAPSSPYVFIYEGLDKVGGLGGKLTAGQLLGHIHASFPGIEMGWAAGPNGPALAAPHYSEGQQTAEGKSFMRLLQDLAHGKAVGGAAVQKVKRVLLQGAKGPLLDMGQAAVDKVRAGANKFIAAHQPTGGIGGIGTRFAGKPGDLLVKGKVSWFTGGATAGGRNASTDAGVALNLNPGTDSGWNNATTQKWMAMSNAGHPQIAVIQIGSHSAALPIIDLGPAGFTQRAIDVTGPGVRQLGLSTASFPTDSIGTASRAKKQLGGFIPPYLGKFHQGGIVPQDGLGLLKGGEAVVPRMKGGGVVTPFAELPNIKALINAIRLAAFGPKAERRLDYLKDKGHLNADQKKELEALKERKKEHQLELKLLKQGGGPGALGRILKAMKKFGPTFSASDRKREHMLGAIAKGLTKHQRHELKHLKSLDHLSGKQHKELKHLKSLDHLSGKQHKELKHLKQIQKGLTKEQHKELMHLHQEARRAHRAEEAQKLVENRRATEKELLSELKGLRKDEEKRHADLLALRASMSLLRALTDSVGGQLGVRSRAKSRNAAVPGTAGSF